MPPPHTTRTIGPLHLEDLDPRRFEDLVRQLVYSFRTWSMLEATGRSGSDSGFDARAWEALAPFPSAAVEGDDEAPDDQPSGERLWLIQCKRERAIAPKKIKGYFGDIPADELEKLDAILFVASADLSKTARDVFRSAALVAGVREVHIWGRGEIEDRLFLPENDGLLFAYFGITIQPRRRSLKTAIRARLTTKRKCKGGLNQHGPVLIRTPRSSTYPHSAADEKESDDWAVARVESIAHDGVRIQFRRHFAMIADDGVGWDYIETLNDARMSGWEDPWLSSEDEDRRHVDRVAAQDLWMALPERNRAWFEVCGVIPFDNILDVDVDGDEVAAFPHLYVAEFASLEQILAPYGFYYRLSGIEHPRPRLGSAEKATRLLHFPRAAVPEERAAPGRA